MASNQDEVIRLILQMQGKEHIKELEKNFKDCKEQLVSFTEKYGEHDQRTQEAAGRVDFFRERIAIAKTELKEHTEATKAADFSTRDWAKTIMDSQGRVKSFAGDISNLAMSLGAGVGLASVIQVAVFELIKLGGKLLDMVKPAEEAGSAIDGLKKHIKELEDKKITLAIDLLELDNAKAKLKELEDGAKAYQAAMHGQTKQEHESGKAVKEYFENMTPEQRDKTFDKAAASKLTQDVANNPEMKKLADEIAFNERVSANKNLPFESRQIADALIEKFNGERQNLRAKIEKESHDEFGAIWGGAEKGDSGKQNMLVNLLKGAGLGDAAGEVERRSVGGIEAFNAQKEAIEAAPGEHLADLEKFGPEFAKRMKKKITDSADKKAKEELHKVEQQVKELVNDLSKGGLADKFFGGEELGIEDVKDELGKTMPAEVVGVMAGPLLAKLNEQLYGEVGRYAHERSMTIPQARAAKADETLSNREAAKIIADQKRIAAEKLKADKAAGKVETAESKEIDELTKESERGEEDYNQYLETKSKGFLNDRNMKAQLEKAFLGGGTVEQIGPMLGKFLEETGAVGKGEGADVGATMAGDTLKELKTKMIGLQAAGFSQVGAIAQMQDTLMVELDKNEAKLGELDRLIQSNMMKLNRMKTTRMRQVRR